MTIIETSKASGQGLGSIRFGLTGKVKWFDALKGFGFIEGPEGQNIFVHYTDIVSKGYRVLQEGSTVNYNAVYGDKGWAAKVVVKI